MVIVCILALTTIRLWSMKERQLKYRPFFRGKITVTDASGVAFSR
jgi:hypothetical protein